ncbi:MAG: hypothetical protein QOF02_658 [Blastocatellia bacterium]|nr:hypothetical protein [Blastocatellia bacterium]
MRDIEIREGQALNRINDFGQSRAADFPAASLGGQKFAEVKALVSALDDLGEEQANATGGAQSSAEIKANHRVTLKQMLRAIRQTAKAIDADKPGTSEKFKFPATKSDETLINAARSIASEAQALAADFTQREMAPTFVADLNTIIDGFENADNSLNLYTGKRVSSTAGIKATLAQARQLRGELNSIVTNKYRNDPASLAAWESASHVERPPVSTKKSTAKKG